MLKIQILRLNSNQYYQLTGVNSLGKIKLFKTLYLQNSITELLFLPT